MRILKIVAGLLLVLVGFLALVTPLTPGAWLALIGLELLGIRLTAWDSVKAWLRKKILHRDSTKNGDTHVDRE